LSYGYVAFHLVPVIDRNGRRIQYLCRRSGVNYIRCQVGGKRYLCSIPHGTVTACQKWIKAFLWAARFESVYYEAKKGKRARIHCSGRR